MTEVNPYTTPQSGSEYSDEAYQPKIFTLQGRIGRLRYLTYSMIYNLIFYAIFMVLAVISGAMGEAGTLFLGITTVVLYIGLLVFVFGVGKRRLNDLDKTGWMLLLFIVPLVNILFALYMLFASGTRGENRYGPPPVKNHPLLWVGILGPFAMLGILASVALPAYQEYVQRVQSLQSELQQDQ